MTQKYFKKFNNREKITQTYYILKKCDSETYI